MASREDIWVKVGPGQARKAAKVYASLGDRTPRERTSTVGSMAYVVWVASLAGLVLRRGPVTVIAGTASDFRRMFRVRFTIAVAVGPALAILLNTALPVPQRLWASVAFEAVVLALIIAILPSRRFHRTRGVLPSLRVWKKWKGAREVWMLYALIHDPKLPADELESTLRSLVPDTGAASAALVCTTAESQVEVLQRLGFVRDSERRGLMYRTSDERNSNPDGLSLEVA
ncbi:hypothetical protein ACIPWF_23085 [Paenarthrobacter sp. NPDC089989]|uniref:hypothetical protein n=1 Tax=unclassified Paenarthrobacter TaxID=2634190 RepID=UPI00381AB4B9